MTEKSYNERVFAQSFPYHTKTTKTTFRMSSMFQCVIRHKTGNSMLDHVGRYGTFYIAIQIAVCVSH